MVRCPLTNVAQGLMRLPAPLAPCQIRPHLMRPPGRPRQPRTPSTYALLQRQSQDMADLIHPAGLAPAPLPPAATPSPSSHPRPPAIDPVFPPPPPPTATTDTQHAHPSPT